MSRRSLAEHVARSAKGLAVSLAVVAALAVALAITVVGDEAQDLWGDR